MSWRRISGAFLMITGAAVSTSVVVTAGVIVARYLQLDSAADALGNAASVAAPVMLVGTTLLLLGRWIYGDWNDRSPVVHAIAFFIRSAGTFVAAGLGAMLAFILLTGIKPEDTAAAVMLGVGTSAGIGLIFLGMRIRKGSGRSYLD